jgi:hypothetical protein
LSEEEQKSGSSEIDDKEHADKSKKSFSNRIMEKAYPRNSRQDPGKSDVSFEKKSPSLGTHAAESELLSLEEMKRILSARINDSDRRIRELQELEKLERESQYEKSVVEPLEIGSKVITPIVNNPSISEELEKYHKLLRARAIDKDEYEKLKNNLINRPSSSSSYPHR